MSIISISKIQHRRGLLDDLPQLSSAELGWALDERRLYIGNGLIEEGAPELGNTEILTQYSDILALLNTYSYKGEDAGYIATTGVDANSPTVRSIQSKLDDFANVKDFGATGDGTTDDTVAINRALYQLYARQSNPQVRRVLFFPAGTYIVSDIIKVPTYTTIVGDGSDGTIIKQTAGSGTIPVIIKTADSLQQVDANLGLNAATLPGYIDIRDLTLWNNTAYGGVDINTTKQIRFTNVKFLGNQSTPNALVTTSKAIVINSTSSLLESQAIQFIGCQFSNFTYGIYCTTNASGVTGVQNWFYNLFQGVYLGKPGSGEPKGFKFAFNLFDKIYTQGIYSDTNVTNTSSSFNYFKDVGNNLLGAGFPATAVIDFYGNGCSSFADVFDRNDTDAATWPRIKFDSATFSNFYSLPEKEIRYGYEVNKAQTAAVTLADNTGSPTSSGITLNINNSNNGILTYHITRGTTKRIGQLRIEHDATAQSYDEDFTENNGSVGVTFSLTYAANVTTINYTTTSTGSAATMHYQLKYIV